MSGKSGCYLLEGLVNNGYVSVAPAGGPGLRTQPSIQVAPRGLHWKHDTLCLIANDLDGMKSVVAALLKDLPDAPPPRPVTWAGRKQLDSDKPSAIDPAVSFTGNNELIVDLKFDRREAIDGGLVADVGLHAPLAQPLGEVLRQGAEARDAVRDDDGGLLRPGEEPAHLGGVRHLGQVHLDELQ